MPLVQASVRPAFALRARAPALAHRSTLRQIRNGNGVCRLALRENRLIISG